MHLIVAALSEELPQSLYNKKPRVVITGIGKTDATTKLVYELLQNRREPTKIKSVINFGTAGSNKFQRGEVVQCHRFINRDALMKDERLVKYGFYNEVCNSVNRVFEGYTVATCFTGDKFLNYFETYPYNGVCDMEAFSLASVCQGFDVPFYCFKVVSDGSNPESFEQWQHILRTPTETFTKIYEQFFE